LEIVTEIVDAMGRGPETRHRFAPVVGAKQQFAPLEDSPDISPRTTAVATVARHQARRRFNCHHVHI
jgi:hypothetical protein